MILDQRVMAEAYCSTANLGAGFNVFGLALSKYAEASPLLEISYHQIREQLEPLWNRKVVPIVSGFVASTVDGSITTLGRGESDYTAALLGAAFSGGRNMDLDRRRWIDVRMVAQGSSEYNVSFVVSHSDGPEAVRAIHEEFNLGG